MSQISPLTDVDILRWPAKEKVAVVLDLVLGKTTPEEASRIHGLNLDEVQQWRSEFLNQGVMSASNAVHGLTLDFLSEGMACDVRASLETGIAAGVVFEDEGGPDELFRAAVLRAIRAIQAKSGRHELLLRFLLVGPYVDNVEIQPSRARDHMNDREVAATIRFLFSSVINSFKGQLAELLAVGPVVRQASKICEPLREANPPRIFMGDTVYAHPQHGKKWAKAADFHLLNVDGCLIDAKAVSLCGVVEVKSYVPSAESLQQQVERHLGRAQRGLRVQGREFKPDAVHMGGSQTAPAQIVVVPDQWELPRQFWFEKDGTRSFLALEPPTPPFAEDRIERLGANQWKVTLRWSEEALADMAYAMTFWYMGVLGEVLYERTGVPPELSGMTPAEAGQNAVVMMLYYAALRAKPGPEQSRAVALYNSYGFGYALGSNFIDRLGRREILLYEDLEEILTNGHSRTKGTCGQPVPQRCRIRGFEWASGKSDESLGFAEQRGGISPPRSHRPEAT